MPPRCIFAKVKLMLNNLPLSLQPSPIARENPGGSWRPYLLFDGKANDSLR